MQWWPSSCIYLWEERFILLRYPPPLRRYNCICSSVNGVCLTQIVRRTHKTGKLDGFALCRSLVSSGIPSQWLRELQKLFVTSAIISRKICRTALNEFCGFGAKSVLPQLTSSFFCPTFVHVTVPNINRPAASFLVDHLLVFWSKNNCDVKFN